MAAVRGLHRVSIVSGGRAMDSAAALVSTMSPQQEWARMRSRWFGPALAVDTPAKLNLQLSVFGRRSDGYHELETVMVSIGLYDTLVFEPVVEPEAPNLELICDGLAGNLRPDESNLVFRAARRLQSLAEMSRSVRIRLTKRIPMQAGLGGGSSDAAAALVGLNAFWNLGLTQPELHAHAATLGSDVNFFLDSAPLAVCRGRGEQIAPGSLKGPIWFVVAKPSQGLSTAAVFQQLDLAQCSRPACAPLLEACRQGDIGHLATLLSNDLEPPSRQLSSEISTLLDRLARTRLSGCRMTGSGSACFGLARNRQQAEEVAQSLRRHGTPEVYVVQTAV